MFLNIITRTLLVAYGCPAKPVTAPYILVYGNSQLTPFFHKFQLCLAEGIIKYTNNLT